MTSFVFVSVSPSPYLWTLTASLLSFAHHLLFSGFSFSGIDAEWPAGRLVGNRVMKPMSQGQPVPPNEFEESWDRPWVGPGLLKQSFSSYVLFCSLASILHRVYSLKASLLSPENIRACMGHFLMATHIRWTILLLQARGPLHRNYTVLIHVIATTKLVFFLFLKKSGQTWETLLND